MLINNSSAHTILVTGSTGFVGRALCNVLGINGKRVKAVVRQAVPVDVWSQPVSQCEIDDLGTSSWDGKLDSVDVVIHLAARVHVMLDTTSDPLAEFRVVNTFGTLNLARQAAEAGVKRFIFISSIKVNGEFTRVGKPFTETDTPDPRDPYGISKFEAEEGLLAIAKESNMEIVIIRPPLVYGPGVKANFLSMMSWLNKRVPLPLGAVHNKRSLVALDNLVDLIVACVDHPRAANQLFLVSDGVDLSTSELLQRMSEAMGKPVRLVPVPAWLLKSGATLLGRRDVAQRLLGSLQLDITKTQEILNWSPPISVDEGLKRTADDFFAEKRYSLVAMDDEVRTSSRR